MFCSGELRRARPQPATCQSQPSPDTFRVGDRTQSGRAAVRQVSWQRPSSSPLMESLQAAGGRRCTGRRWLEVPDWGHRWRCAAHSAVEAAQPEAFSEGMSPQGISAHGGKVCQGRDTPEGLQPTDTPLCEGTPLKDWTHRWTLSGRDRKNKGQAKEN